MSQYKYNVINVGQGDCIIIENHLKRCKYSGYKIITDLGNGNIDIFKNLSQYEFNLILCLTHSHNDHIGGLKNLNHHIKNVKEIWLPAYYQEIIKITKMLLKLKGIEKIQNEDVEKCKNSIELHEILVKNFNNMAIKFVYEGINICSHIKILNPPLNISSIFDIEDKKFESKLLKDNYNDIEKWFENDINLQVLFNMDEFIERDNEIISKQVNKIKRKKFFIKFINYLKEDIENYLKSPVNINFSKIYEKVKLTVNDCSIVNTYNYTENKKIVSDSLFTGDASTKIFDRLLANNKLKRINILKVPHHGSKENLNQNIVDFLNPDIAIVSHNNLKGNGKDTHPNREVIDILRNKGINTLYTNDVKKKIRGYNIKSPTGNCKFVNNVYFIK